MACSCKSNSSSKQVTAVKQVVKKINNQPSSSPVKKNILQRKTIIRRPM